MWTSRKTSESSPEKRIPETDHSVDGSATKTNSDPTEVEYTQKTMSTPNSRRLWAFLLLAFYFIDATGKKNMCVCSASVSFLHLASVSVLQFCNFWSCGLSMFSSLFICVFLLSKKNIIIFPKRSNFASCDFYKIVCFKNFMKHICFWRFYQHQLSHSMQMDCSAFDLWSLVQPHFYAFLPNYQLISFANKQFYIEW